MRCPSWQTITSVPLRSRTLASSDSASRKLTGTERALIRNAASMVTRIALLFSPREATRSPCVVPLSASTGREPGSLVVQLGVGEAPAGVADGDGVGLVPGVVHDGGGRVEVDMHTGVEWVRGRACGSGHCRLLVELTCVAVGSVRRGSGTTLLPTGPS